ncbi:MAG: ABC transporter substrate-binding protein [Candidatus Gracilibacteria bacterium]|jgi:peptide/nickel transport system substrate-binding protein
MKLSRLLPILALLLASCTPQELLTGGTGESVTIAYAEPISSYSPLTYEAKNRKYLVNLYEPLVRFDASFNTESALAVSWGRLDEKTWDFRLRKGVVFHDGQAFNADSVLYSLQLAREYEGSELESLLSSVASVEKIDEFRVQIRTDQPDPLLLNELSFVNMVPVDYENFDLPVGTGPYRASQLISDTLVLERFEGYWGPLAYFKEARLQYIPDFKDRLEGMLSGEIGLLANVPPQGAAQLAEHGILLEEAPGLENSFLFLNQNTRFADPNVRAAVWHALGSDFAEKLGGGHLRASSQFAATGITGYDPEVPERSQNLDLAWEYRHKLPEEMSLTLDIPEGLESLGEMVQEDLAVIDIAVTVRSTATQEYEDLIMTGLSDFYFFGWKYDLADGEDFFTGVVHSPVGTYGTFNAFGYADASMDRDIEALASLFDPMERREALTLLSSRLLETQTVLPLFESEVLYALSPDLYYDFRLDGQIWASEIIENVVE